MRALLRLYSRILPCLALALVSAAARADEPPNILFLFADDLCYKALGAMGNEEIETPNLDRLARQGTTFTQTYNMGAWGGAVCVASRAMLNTGRFLWHAHGLAKQNEQERQAGRFWSEYLRRAGYETYFTGKWHVQADATKAFDMARHVRGGMPNQTNEGYNRPIEGQPDPWSPFDPKFGGFWKGGKHWSEVVADDTVAFLERASSRAAPYFMYIAFNAPHDPRQSPQEYVDKYPWQSLRMPASFLPEYPFKDAMGCSERLRDEKLAPFPRTEYAVKVNRQEYYAIITHMDAQIGRILNALDQSGKADNTYVFFTADHGLAVGHHGLLGKQNLYDHSVRVPFMVTGPGVAQGARNSTRIYLQDVMPTTLELAGVPLPEHVQFKSLLPLMRGDAATPYDAIYGAYTELQRMVTQGNYKLLLYPAIGRARLFNVSDDPEEMVDLTERPESAPTMRALFQRLLTLQQEAGDTLDLRTAYPHLNAAS